MIKEQQEQIKDVLRALLPNRKKGSNPTKTERLFMHGVLNTLNILYPNLEDPDNLSLEIPPAWAICVMSGRSILDL